MAFKNTVETVGDAALTRSIIDRSITELNCNITTSIRQYAFRACAALASVNFPNVTSVANGAFYDCTALAKVDLASPVAFATNAFYGCTALTALILRNTEQISTLTGTPFANTPIASGTGYIYVPAALVDQYKASWTTYAAQIRAIEDYPGIDDPYSWVGVAANIADGSYASMYKIGDLVPLDLGTEGVVNMQIAGIDVDNLADGSGKAHISWVSEGLLATERRWNPAIVKNSDGTYQEGTGAVGGWEKCELRAYMNDTIEPIIPANVREMIKNVTKQQNGYNTNGVSEQQSTNDKVWIPSMAEIYSAGGIYTVLFDSNDSRVKRFKNSTISIGDYWWLRDPFYSNNGKLRVIGTGGSLSDGDSYGSRGIALGFCT